MSKYAIKLEHVSFSYGPSEVLSDVSFEIEHGHYVGVIGPNGGGKTTLLKLLLGLIKPQAGLIHLAAPEDSQTPLIGYVPQFMNFDRSFPISVLDVVLMGRLSFSEKFRSFNDLDKQCALEALEMVDLKDCQSRMIGQLSGGEIQRVFLARALASKPSMLFLDEPTASIDSRIEQEFYALLKKLNQQMTILLVSHDIGAVAREVSDIVCVNREVTVHDTKTITRQNIADFYKMPVNCVQHHCNL